MQKTQQDKKGLEAAGCTGGMKMRNMHFSATEKLFPNSWCQVTYIRLSFIMSLKRGITYETNNGIVIFLSFTTEVQVVVIWQ